MADPDSEGLTISPKPPTVETTPTRWESLDAEDWVPVEDRVAGFDRRSIWPGVVLLVVWVVWSLAMPAGNAVLDFDDPTAAGDVIDLGGGITMVAAPGWQLSGSPRSRTGHRAL